MDAAYPDPPNRMVYLEMAQFYRLYWRQLCAPIRQDSLFLEGMAHALLLRSPTYSHRRYDSSSCTPASTRFLEKFIY